MVTKMKGYAAFGAQRLRDAWGRVVGDDRGDVPGWVLITLMTAGLQVKTSIG